MMCAWKELLAILPAWMRRDVDDLGADSLRELRLRMNSPPELIFSERSFWLGRNIVLDDLNYTINAASCYSPWAAESMAQGYITAPGGHRVGLCGDAVVQKGQMTGMKNISSLCIRIARNFPGIASEAAKLEGSILVLGPPGWGKTTLLRDLICQLSKTEKICVMDERRELFPEGLRFTKRIDVLSGCSKRDGIPMLLRTMGPSCIAVDEITEPEDVRALLQAANCGVRLLATAHALSARDFVKRFVYKPLLENQIFDELLVLKKDKTYTMERVTQWNQNGLVQY